MITAEYLLLRLFMAAAAVTLTGLAVAVGKGVMAAEKLVTHTERT